MTAAEVIAVVDRLKLMPPVGFYFGMVMLVPIVQTTYIFSQAMPICLGLLVVAGAFEVRSTASLLGATRAPLFCAAIAFAAYAMLSCLWSPAVADTLIKGAGFGAVAVAALVGAQLARLAGTPSFAIPAKGIVAGLAAAMVYVSVETATDQWITRTAMTYWPSLQLRFVGKHISVVDNIVVFVSDGFMNRPTAVVSLLLFPGWLVARATLAKGLQWTYAVLSALFIALVLAKSRHQSSQLAILAGGTIAVLAATQYRAAWRLVLTAWCLAVLSFPLVAVGLHKAGLHNADWLFTSARARVVIWKTTVDRIGAHPILGAGAAATELNVRSDRMRAAGEIIEKGPFDPNEHWGGRHAHNIYLQTWFELGLVGVLLLLQAGLSVLTSVNKLDSAIRPWALGGFATVAAMLGFSYGLWQVWFLSAIAVAFVLSVFGIEGGNALVIARQRNGAEHRMVSQ